MTQAWSGMLVADLTDPLLSADEASGVFAVVVQQFVRSHADTPKLLMLDGAHKYLFGEEGALQSVLRHTVQNLRHRGTRVVVSTQSPCALPGELLELASCVVLHSFHSRSWLAHLRSRVPLSEDALEEVAGLATGEALLFVRGGLLREEPAEGEEEEEEEDVDGGEHGRRRADPAAPTANGYAAGDGEEYDDEDEEEDEEEDDGAVGGGRYLGLQVYRAQIRQRVTRDGGKTLMSTRAEGREGEWKSPAARVE
jgi:hypothetical protein